ncbi:MAG: glutamate--tRNA ligase [bacterium]
MNNQNEVRVRMAPSPTGFFHVGSARTALFNWLFAKHHKGKFILRVEDTDAERSSEAMIDIVLEGMKWLGMGQYEGPYFQSKRMDLYKEYIKKLLDTGKAYYCYCDPEDLDKERKAAYARKEDWKYDRRCLSLSEADKKKKDQSNTPKAVRFLIPEHAVTYNDIVYGEISRDSKNIEDFIIQRANGMPTYNLACVVDDQDMRISHVIRGADHITNTPKQILLYEALDLTKPEYAHLPLILGPDKSKLSKRHGAISIMDYKNNGFRPDAVVNYLALLGWSPGDDKEIMSIDQLIERFTLERINSSNAVFDATKLEWMNQQHIMQMPRTEFREELKPFIIEAGLMTEKEIEQNVDWVQSVCDLMQARLKVLSDIDKQGRYFFKDDFVYDQPVLEKFCNTETLEIMEKIVTALQNIEPFNTEQLETNLRNFGEDYKLKVKQWIHPLRVFTTGTKAGPPLFDTLELIGRKRCISRIEKILK